MLLRCYQNSNAVFFIGAWSDLRLGPHSRGTSRQEGAWRNFYFHKEIVKAMEIEQGPESSPNIRIVNLGICIATSVLSQYIAIEGDSNGT
jgi:hypothetical protein